MPEQDPSPARSEVAVAPPTPGQAPQGIAVPSHAEGEACGCGGGETCTCGATPSIERVYALGQLGFDFGTEARRDSIMQHMDGDPSDPSALLAYLEAHPWDAASLTWTLNLDATPIYAIQPYGAFAEEGYRRLRTFLQEQLTEGVERVAVPGVIIAKTRLMSGQVVPVIHPVLRCMYSWTTADLVEPVCGEAPAASAKQEAKDAYHQKINAVAGFLDRVYFELRNLGISSEDRAINAAATNAFNVEHIFSSALKANMELGAIEAMPSPICRPGSDCWDVILSFFDPENVLRSKKTYRFAVDVSDVCPVMVGQVRAWSVR